jgi:hypothetical protein
MTEKRKLMYKEKEDKMKKKAQEKKQNPPT